MGLECSAGMVVVLTVDCQGSVVGMECLEEGLGRAGLEATGTDTAQWEEAM